jgi:hypothetical protein
LQFLHFVALGREVSRDAVKGGFQFLPNGGEKVPVFNLRALHLLLSSCGGRRTAGRRIFRFARQPESPPRAAGRPAPAPPAPASTALRRPSCAPLAASGSAHRALDHLGRQSLYDPGRRRQQRATPLSAPGMYIRPGIRTAAREIKITQHVDALGHLHPLWWETPYHAGYTPPTRRFLRVYVREGGRPARLWPAISRPTPPRACAAVYSTCPRLTLVRQKWLLWSG